MNILFRGVVFSLHIYILHTGRGSYLVMSSKDLRGVHLSLDVVVSFLYILHIKMYYMYEQFLVHFMKKCNAHF